MRRCIDGQTRARSMRVCVFRRGRCLGEGGLLTTCADLDRAIGMEDQNGHDPTGGRGVNTDMGSRLKGKEKEKEEETLESAV